MLMRGIYKAAYISSLAKSHQVGLITGELPSICAETSIYEIKNRKETVVDKGVNTITYKFNYR